MKKIFGKVSALAAAAALAASAIPGVFAATDGTSWVNDSFSGGEIPTNWVQAYSDAGQVSAFEVKDGQLYYATDAAGNGINKEPGALLKLNGDNGITYSEDKKIELRFKVKVSGTAVWHLKADLLDHEGMNGYLCQGWRGQNDLMMIKNGVVHVKNTNGIMNGNTAYSQYTQITSDETSVEGKEVEVLGCLDGLNRKADWVISVDGKNYTVTDCDWSSYNDGIHKLTEGKLETLAFVSDNEDDTNRTFQEVCIDDVSVREITDGAFCDTFADGSTEGWIANSSDTKTAIDVTDEGYLHYVTTNTGVESSTAGGVVRPVNGGRGVSFGDDDMRILQFRVKKNNGAVLYVNLDTPITGGKTICMGSGWYDGADGSDWRGALNIMKVYDDHIAIKTGLSGDKCSTAYWDGFYVDTKDKWVDCAIAYNGTTQTAQFIVSCNGRTHASVTERDYSSMSGIGGDYWEGKWKTISFLSYKYRDGKVENDNPAYGEVWIDSVSVRQPDTLFNDTFETGSTNWIPTAHGTNATLQSMEVKNGRLHFSSNNAGASYNNTPGVARIINGLTGLEYDENSRYVLKYTVNKATAGAGVDVRLDQRLWRDSDNDQGTWRGTLSIMQVRDDKIMIKNGQGYLNGTDAASTHSEWKQIPGDTVGKDIEVTAVLDGKTRLANYTIKFDGKTYTYNDCDWSDYDEAWLKHTENLTSLAFCTFADNDSSVADVYIDNVSLEKQAATAPAVMLWKNGPVSSIGNGDSVGALYQITPGVDGFGKYYVILAGYKVSDDGILEADQVKVLPINAAATGDAIAEPTEDTITVPSEGNYVVKAFLWEDGTQKPIAQNATAETE